MAVLPGGSPRPSSADVPLFDVVIRGYDRDQVNVHVRDLGEKLAAAAQAQHAADQRIRTLEEELRAARKRDADAPMSQESFGFRAEKILRLAEHEAADVRARAAKEATAVVEQARADAERHRHEVEQKLIARSTELDADHAKRNVAVQEREQQAQVTLADAREESKRITDEAQRSAEKTLADAQGRAEQLRMRTDNECRRRREIAEQELGRIGDLRDGVRADIVRLHTLLSGEIAGNTSPTAAGAAVRGSSAAAAPSGGTRLGPAPTSTGPTSTGPTSAAPTNTAPTNTAPTNTAPTNTAPTNAAPIGNAPANVGPTGAAQPAAAPARAVSAPEGTAANPVAPAGAPSGAGSSGTPFGTIRFGNTPSGPGAPSTPAKRAPERSGT